MLLLIPIFFEEFKRVLMGFIRYKISKTNNLPFLPIWSFQVCFQMLYQAQKLIKTHIKMTAVSSCCFWAQAWVPCWPAPPLAYWCRCVIWGFLPCLILKSQTPNSYVDFSHSLHWNSSWWLKWLSQFSSWPNGPSCFDCLIRDQGSWTILQVFQFNETASLLQCIKVRSGWQM